MEQRNLKINQISVTKKSRRIKNIAPRDPKPKPTSVTGGNLQNQVLSWDGLASAISFSVPFVVIIAINFQSALALVAILTSVLLPVSMLRFCMREKLGFPEFLTVPVCALVSVGITAFAAVIIRSYFPQINDSLGIYIYLMAAYPVAAAAFFGKKARRLGTTVVWALRNILYFSSAVLLTGIIREFLAYNRFMGFSLSMNFKLEAAKMPFFGFVVFAFVLAAATRIHMAVKERFPSPVVTEPEETDEAAATAEIFEALESDKPQSDDSDGTLPQNHT